MPKSLRCILEVYQCIEPLRITQPKFIAESNSILAILQPSFANSRSTNAVFLRNVNIDIDQNHYELSSMKQNLLDSLVVPSSWNSRDGGGCGAYVTQGSSVGTRKSHVAPA